jgi:monoamine oxidase
VVVSVTDPTGHRQQIESDYLIMAVPASTLREIDIQPALPEDQRHTIDRLSYGRATKVLLQSSTKLFGGRRARAFATDGCVGAFWDASEEQGHVVLARCVSGARHHSSCRRSHAALDVSRLPASTRANAGRVT